jgi:hypothetical protein
MFSSLTPVVVFAIPTFAPDVLRFMTDPILVKLLLNPLASNLELEFFRLTPAPSGGVFDPFLGEVGVQGPAPVLAPHWSTSLYATNSGIVFDRTDAVDLAPKIFFVDALGAPEDDVASERFEDNDGEGGKAGPPGYCRYECGEAGGPSNRLDAEAEANRCRVGEEVDRDEVDGEV